MFYSFFALALSGCAGAVFGVGTAAVAASTTEKGFSTSVTDGVIFAKLKDRFIQVNASLLTSADVAVNDGAVLFTGKVKTPEDKIEATTDYKTITKKIIAFIEDNKFELVETFAEKIAEMVITDFDVNWIRLRVSKPGALRFSKDVGVIIERTASDYE